MDWLTWRMKEIPGDGTTEAPLECFVLSFHCHIATDDLDLWSIRNAKMTKHEKKTHKLALVRLRQEVAEEEAAELVGDTALVGRKTRVVGTT